MGHVDTGHIRIGTSGWNYRHWKGAFYPEGLSSHEWLDYYRGTFAAVEINKTFYNLPEAEQFEHWAGTVQPQFVFAVKMSRYLTHMKKLKDPEQSVTRFFRAVSALGDHLGPVLFQLPPRWRPNLQRLENVLSVLPRGVDYAFEFRDQRWYTPEVYDLLRRYGASFCIYHLAGHMSPLEVTSDLVYLRLHGPGKAYKGSYDDATLREWAARFRQWRDEGRAVYCFFDNDQRGYAARDAARLQELVGSSDA